MKKILFFIIISILLIQATLNILPQENNYSGKVINKIIFKGLKRARVKDLIDVLQSEEGKLFDLDLVNRDYQSLFGLGYFEDIVISTEKAYDENTNEEKPNMINLVFEFVEKPSIRKIIFRGNKALGFAKLMDAISIKRGSFIDLAMINSDISAMLEKYNDKGFNYTDIEYEIYEDENLKIRNKVDIIFKINEGIESYVSDIIINGNNSVSDFTIKNKMKTKERKFLGLQKGVFKESQFYQDIEEIKKYYKDIGYYLVEVLEPEIVRYEIEENGIKKEIIRININIIEGDQFIFGGMILKGNKIISTDDLLFGSKLRQGNVFSYSRYQETLFSMQMRYNERGYVETIINDRQDIDYENKIITVFVEIIESKRSYIEAVYFKGNEKTRDYVLRRTIVTEAGEIFNANKLTGSMINLYNLGFFSSVDYDIQAGSAPGLLVITYVVEEQKTAEVRFGISIPANEWPPELTLFGEIKEQNLFGRELVISGKLETSLYRQGFNFSIDDPWFFNFPWSIGASVKLYHYWDRLVLREIEEDDYKDFDEKNEDEIREEYNEKYQNNEQQNPNYIGYQNNSFFDMGLNYLNWSFEARTGYRFFKYFGIGGNFSVEPMYSWMMPQVGCPDDLNNELQRDILVYNYGWTVKNIISSTFSITTTQRRVNPFQGIKYSFTAGYIFGHFDAFKLSSKFTAYIKVLDLDFGNWPFQNVLVFNAGASLIFPGFRNFNTDPSNIVFGKQRYGMGPILYDSDLLTVDGFFAGRGWGGTLGSYSTAGTLSMRTGYVKLDFSLEYRFPIVDKIVWFAAFIDMINLIEGPYRYTDAGHRDDSVSWAWWKDNGPGYQPMGIDNWYGSIGAGLEFTFPQLPLSFFVVKRFKINYFTGIEWIQDDSYSKTGYLDFVLSIVGYYF